MMERTKKNQNKLLLSIIVPVYNVELYLENCIESLLAQKLSAYEIILVDDGSTDSSGEICDRYNEKYKQIKVIHKKNGGLSSARNTGIECAQGKYIGFVDSDDYIAPQMYIELISLAEKNSAEIAVCDFFNFHDQADLIKAIDKEKKKKRKIAIYDTEAAVKALFVRNIPESVCTNIFLNIFWGKRRFVEGEINEDTNVLYELLASAEKTVMIKKHFYGYRRRKGSITNRGYSDEFKVVTKHMEYLEKDVRKVHPELLPYMYHFLSVHYFCLLIAISYDDKYGLYASDYQLYRKKLKKLFRYFIRWEKFRWKEYIIAFILIMPHSRRFIKMNKQGKGDHEK